MNGIVAYRFRVSPAIFAPLPDKGHQEGGMSDAGEDGPLHLPEPASGGEIFEAYYQRAIVDDALWPGLAQASSYFGFDVALGRPFYPARFTPSMVRELHDGIESLRLNDPGRTRTLIDHLWRSRGGSAMPLDVRMIPYQRPLPDSLPEALPPDPVVQEQLAVWRRAARRRDSLVAALCEALRRGTYICTGFLATDPMRQQVVISSEWWADSSFQLSPLKAKTVPVDGLPHYRGMRLAAAGQPDVATIAQGEVRAAKPEGSTLMLLALDELLAAGSTFRDVKIAHSAVLKKLKIKDAARGYSYKTFHRIAAGRLKRS